MPVIRLHIEYPWGLDALDWQRKHAAGLVPNQLPYGFHLLAQQGFELVVRSSSSHWLMRRAVSVGSRLSGGFDVVDATRDWRRRSCDLAVCWAETAGVPTAARSALPGEPPVVMGSIWITGSDHGLSPLKKKMVEKSLQRTAGIWANTEEQLAVLKAMGVASSKLHLLYNPGVDSDFWFCDGAEPEPGLVLSVGNDRHRDFDFLLGAMRVVRARIPTSRLELVTRQRVEVPAEWGSKYSEESHSHLRTRYGRASVVAIATTPNIHVSGATTVLEAMACQRPVVVTEHPGYDGYVSHGITGLIVPPGDQEAFADAVETLLGDPHLAREMGRAGRAAVETRYSSELFMQQLGGVLRTALDGV